MNHEAWLQQAESDLAAASSSSNAGFHSQAVWFAAQVVEKGHKAILAALGLRYEDKHFKKLGHGTGEIAKLLPEALHQPIDPRIAGMVAKLEERALSSRYPAPGVGAAQLRAPAAYMVGSQEDVSDARELLEWCRSRVIRATRAEQAMGP